MCCRRFRLPAVLASSNSIFLESPETAVSTEGMADQIGLPGGGAGMVLLIAVEGPSPLWVAPSLGGWAWSL